MVNIGESFASGMAQGMQLKMLKLKELQAQRETENEEEADFEAKMLKLKKLQDQRKTEMEKQKADFEAQQNLMKTVLDVTDDWLSAYRKLPINKRSQFMQNYVNLPIFQDRNAPKWVKDYAVGMAGMSDETLKNTQNVLQMFKKGQQTKNPNLMSQAYYEGIALLDPKEAPAFQGFFDRAEDLIFGPKPSSKIDIALQGMQKSTAGALEKDIVEGRDFVESLKSAERKFRDPAVMQFVDVPGAAKDAWVRLRRHFRIPVGKKSNEAFDKWIDGAATLLQAMAIKKYAFYKGSLTGIEMAQAEQQWPTISTKLEWKRFLLGTDDPRTLMRKIRTTIEFNEAALKRLEVVRRSGKVVRNPETGIIEGFFDVNGQPLTVQDFMSEEAKKEFNEVFSEEKKSEKDIDLRIQLRQTYPGISKEKEDEIINKWKAR